MLRLLDANLTAVPLLGNPIEFRRLENAIALFSSEMIWGGYYCTFNPHTVMWRKGCSILPDVHIGLRASTKENLMFKL